MALDITLLQVMKRRQDYDNLRRLIPDRVLDPATESILKDYGTWFKENPLQQVIDFDSFGLWVKLEHPSLADEKLALINAQLKRARQDVDADVRAGIVERLVAAQTARALEDLVTSFTDGDDIQFGQHLRSIMDKYEERVARQVKTPFCDVDIDELLNEEENDEGIKWRLSVLNEYMRPLRPGDFGCVAMRPGAGKTTFFTSEITFMAPQCPDGRGVFWFNNEGPSKRIVGRCWQSALGMTFGEIGELRGPKGNGHKQAYAAAVGGAGRIRVLDAHDMSSGELEDIIREHNPYIVVIDMVDNVRFGGEMSNGGQRTDQILEAMYQWARILGVKHDCIVLCTSQLNGDAEGLTRPTLAMMKDSKTGKQGALDFLIAIGKSNDPLLAKSRFIGIPKTKLNRAGKPGDPFGYEVILDEDRGRYLMPDDAPDD